MRHAIDGAALRRELARRCLTGAEFAQIAGVSPATVSHVLTHGRAGDSTLRKFARALTITPTNPGADAILPPPPIGVADADQRKAPTTPAASRGLVP